MELQTQRAGGRLQISRLNIATRKSWVDKRSYLARCGEQLVQPLQSFPTQLRVQGGHPCEVAARSVEAGNETDLNRIGAGDEDNGNGARYSLRSYRRLAVRGNNGDLPASQIGCQCWQTIVVTFGPAVFDRHVPTIDIAVFSQALPKRDQEVCILLGRPSVKKPDHRHRRLLRARRHRPRRRRPAEQRDELAAFHSITSSARISTDAGSSIPSRLAVFRLTTSSNLTARSIGRLPGGVPFRILSTKAAERE